jgi:hypothetical protein
MEFSNFWRQTLWIINYLYPNLVPRAFPFLSLGRREKALAPGGHMTFNTQITELYLIYLEIVLLYLVSQECVTKNMADFAKFTSFWRHNRPKFMVNTTDLKY